MLINLPNPRLKIMTYKEGVAKMIKLTQKFKKQERNKFFKSWKFAHNLT